MYSFEQLFLDDDDEDDADCRPLLLVLPLLVLFPVELPHTVPTECASADDCCVHLTGRTRGGVA